MLKRCAGQGFGKLRKFADRPDSASVAEGAGNHASRGRKRSSLFNIGKCGITDI
jgi:hypothetical protein